MKKNSRLLTIVLSLMAFAAVEAATYSESLPVLYINTTGSAEITSTETYVGAATKWKFGPVWNFSDGLCRDGNNFIFAGETKIMHWIDEIYKFPAFVEKVKTLWASFYSSDYSTVGTFIDSFSNQISSAVAADYARWPQYGCADASTAIATFKARLKAKTDYLESVWGENGVDPVFVSMSQADDIVYDIMGRRVTTADRLSSSPLAAGIYILNHKKFIVK